MLLLIRWYCSSSSYGIWRWLFGRGWPIISSIRTDNISIVAIPLFHGIGAFFSMNNILVFLFFACTANGNGDDDGNGATNAGSHGDDDCGGAGAAAATAGGIFAWWRWFGF